MHSAAPPSSTIEIRLAVSSGSKLAVDQVGVAELVQEEEHRREREREEEAGDADRPRHDGAVEPPGLGVLTVRALGVDAPRSAR